MRILFFLLLISFSASAQFANNNLLLASDPDLPSLALGPDSHTFTASEVEAMVLQPYEFLYAQGSVFLNGATFIAYSRLDATPYNEGVSFFRYDNGYGLRRPYPGLLAANTTDNHALTPMFRDNSGYFYAYREDGHATPIDIFKTRNTDDISAWYKLSERIGVGQNLAYPKAIPDGSGNAVSWLRDFSAPDLFGIRMYRASAGGETFGASRQILAQLDESDLDGRHYPTLPLRYKTDDGWYFMEVTFRHLSTLGWTDRYILKTQNFEDYYTYDESSFEDVVTEGSMSLAELAPYLAYSIPADSQMFAPVSCLDRQGHYYSIVTDGGGDYHILYHRNGTWQTKQIATALSFAGETLVEGVDSGNEQLGAFSTLIMYDRRNFDVVVRCVTDVGGTDYNHLKIFRTTNFGDTFSYVCDLNEGSADNWMKNTWPFNYDDIPINQNFLVASFNLDSPAKAHVQTIAQGAPDASGGTWTINTITNFSDISGLVRHYKINAANTTRSGTTLTGCTELTGSGYDWSISGSPVVDDGTTPTHVIFDGSNDVALIDGTGVFTLAQGSGFFVVRQKTSYTAAAAIWSVGSTSNTRHWSFQIRKDAGYDGANAFSNYVTTTNEYKSQTASIASDTDFHVVGFVVDGAGTTLYVDGERQYLETNSALQARLDQGKFYTNLTTPNRLAIGALVRSTTAYTGLDFKEGVFYNRALSEQEVLEVMKKLGADHSITIAGPHPY